jgi:hypothetical protein
MRLQHPILRTRYSVSSAPYRVLLLFVPLLAVGCSGQPPANPQTPESGAAQAASPTPYRNADPDVQYVRDAACAQCHPGQAETFRHHPMGRSLAPLKTAASEDRYDKAAGNPFLQLGVEFRVEHQGERVRHKAVRRDDQGHELIEMDDEVEFVLGSGTRGKSYLINHDGYLFQSPISWFAQKQTWGSTDVAHTAITDHRILRDPQLQDRSLPSSAPSPDEVPIVPFYPESGDYPALDRRRDLGIALIHTARSVGRAACAKPSPRAIGRPGRKSKSRCA